MQNNSRERKSTLRLKDFDYSTDGAYFTTICTQNREKFFGKIENAKMILNEYGKITEQCWHNLPNHYANCRLDEFVIMPNHVHGIIWIDNLFKPDLSKPVGTGLKPVPTSPEPILTPPEPAPTVHDLSEIVRGFKTFSSKEINVAIIEKSAPLIFRWQRSFYDRIIRDEDELNKIRDYILLNPTNWMQDKNFCSNVNE
ncbi:MAG: transposase [Patescibacteria group bacterium]